MKVQKEDLSTLEKKLTIQVDSKDVDKEFNKAFQYLQKNVTIKGFRKGKAPLQKIKILYKDQVKDDVTQSLVQANYIKALTNEDLFPIDQPQLDIPTSPNQGESFQFTAQFEVRPEVEAKNIEGLKIEKQKFVKDEKAIENSLEQIRSAHGTYEVVEEDRGLQKGDFADLDFDGIMNGAPLPNGSAKNHLLEIGSDSFIKGFEEGLIGAKKGEEKSLELSFPEEYQQPELQGKAVTFKVKIHAIKKKQLPEWTDEFVKTLGEYETFEQLKTAISDDIEKQEKSRIEGDLKSNMFKALVAANPFEAPKSMIQQQKGALIDDFKQRMAQQGLSDQQFAEYQAKWNDDFDGTAEEMVKSALLIQKIAEDQKLEIVQADIDAKLADIVKESGLDINRVSDYYKMEQPLNNLKYQLTEEKIFKFLLEKAKVTEVEPKAQENDSRKV